MNADASWADDVSRPVPAELRFASPASAKCRQSTLRTPWRPYSETRPSLERLLHEQFRRLVRPRSRVLEVGCGPGDLLATLDPEFGLGVDHDPEVVRLARSRHRGLEFAVGDAGSFESNGTFDYIVLAHLANDLWDVQSTLSHLRRFAHDKTRILVSIPNPLWTPVLRSACRLDEKTPTLTPSQLTPADLGNLLHLAGWEVVRQDASVLWPRDTPILASLLNQRLAPYLRPLCLSQLCVARPRPDAKAAKPHFRCSVIVPARNEAGSIDATVRGIPEMGLGTEIVFVEGGSTDTTWTRILRAIDEHPHRTLRALRQPGTGKADAVRAGVQAATGDLVMIHDADLTVAPEELGKFYETFRSGLGEIINGTRLVYPLEDHSMRFLNRIANRFFGVVSSSILGRRIKDTLCGTKVLLKSDFLRIERSRPPTSPPDPFGDLDLLLGAARLGLRVVDVPVRYRARRYGTTNIQRWRHGWLLLKLLIQGARHHRFG